MRKALWIALALVMLAGVAIYVSTLEDPVEANQDASATTLRPVGYVSAEVGDHAGVVSVFAEVTPRWQVELRSRVSGVADQVAPTALGGFRVARDTVLLTLEDAPYLANLEEARSTLKTAEFELLQKEKKRDIALKDWRAVNPNVEPPEMAIHLPEVHVAEQRVAAAKARVGAAEFDLRSTTIRAPFDAIITKRSVSPGQSVNEGDVLFSLLDDSQLDIRVSLSAKQWRLLADNWDEAQALLFSEAGEFVGEANVKRGGGFLEPKSRRYQLFLEVENSDSTAVLPGQFVRVALPGRTISSTLQIPESALTQNGFVWYVDDNDRLQRFEATALFRNNGEVIVEAPENSQPEGAYRIVPLPMSAYLPGQQISPVEAGAGK
ncbi:efflux RND transporter periplasmic adaptor subunit [Roseibium sp. SCP14]|uniref:efflux RND transporter periplasmic adaptor subunit n=1 Tax=Roseibium sp. SCP14 TaxID=3141375 RepID=UPI00333B5D42